MIVEAYGLAIAVKQSQNLSGWPLAGIRSKANLLTVPFLRPEVACQGGL